jgi:hypothetical protein
VSAEATLPLEHFIQAVQSQLDNAQTAMAVKARNLNLPLTFAIKDITLDLRAHVEFARSEIRIRPTAPGDREASVFHLVFTTITRPMIEENAVALSEDPEERTLDDLKDELSEEERRRLEWVGVRTVSKLREIEAEGGARTVGRVTSLPVERLRRALERAAAPLVEQVLPLPRPPGEGGADLPALVRVRGRNLTRKGVPRVAVSGEPVSVVRSSGDELVIAPQAHQLHGELQVEPAPGVATTMAFDLRPFWTAPTAAAEGNGGHP